MENLYYIRIDDTINQNTLNYLLTFVSKEKKEQINRYYFNVDKKLSLYADLIVRVIACKTFGLTNKDIDFFKSEYGKPNLNNYLNFHYNVSHTRNAIAVVVSDSQVGVDIEKIREAEFKIVNRFFTQPEIEFIDNTVAESKKRFYIVWTKKEAYIKYIGKGLYIPLNSFNVFDETISKKMQTIVKDNYVISICGINQGCCIEEIQESMIVSMCNQWLVN